MTRIFMRHIIPFNSDMFLTISLREQLNNPIFQSTLPRHLIHIGRFTFSPQEHSKFKIWVQPNTVVPDYPFSATEKIFPKRMFDYLALVQTALS